MADKDASKAKENIGKKGETAKPWQRGKGRQYAPQAKREPGEIPILRFGQGNAFYVFKDAISKAAVEKFGHDGKLFESNILYKPDLPKRAEYVN